MNLHIVASGNGPDLVLLHGWGMHSGVWDETALELCASLRTHRVDLPGHGQSPSCVPYTLDALVDALAAALPPRVMVCGWSLGGLVALAWALRYPAQVERLVLYSTSPCFTRAPDWACGIESEVWDGFARELARDRERTLARFAALQSQGDALAANVLRRLRAYLADAPTPDAATLAAALAILSQADLRPELAGIAQPALIVHGVHDRIVPLAAARYLQSALRCATLRVDDRSAHAPFLSEPKTSARDILEFCT